MKHCVVAILGFAVIAACSSSNSNTPATPAQSSCVVAGVEHERRPLTERVTSSAHAFPCPDGCNTCMCVDDGSMEQTTMACPDCMPAIEPPAGTVCEERVVRMRKPGSSTCCTYSSPCNVPNGLEGC